MIRDIEQKPSFTEWASWAQIVVDRLTTIAHAYNKPPYEDVYMAQDERQTKTAQTVGLLRKIYGFIETPATSTSPADAAERDDTAVKLLLPLIEETLSLLPTVSDDMQLLMKSPWHVNCTGKIAAELFCGPGGREVEGIGSGRAENGRLPEALTKLMEREQSGAYRAPRAEDVPARSTLRRRSSSLGSAGRVD